MNLCSGIKFNRNEWSGAFGDIGTDFPLIVGMILAAGLDSTSVLMMFGIMQILSGIIYKMPMPVQPLKAMAAIVIVQGTNPGIIYGGGLAIGISMLLLNITGLIGWLGKIIPKAVIRGIQFGLGLKLGLLALGRYIPAEGLQGFGLAAISFLLVILLIGNQKYPLAIFIILLGLAYGFIFKIDSHSLMNAVGINLPKISSPSIDDIFNGFLILALPQIPLSLGNSILATSRTAKDLFPEKPNSLRKISFSYSVMNLINPFFGGIPVCHGSGGLIGHYTFGGRTGGSVIIYGSIFILLGLFLSNGFETIIHFFPLPILGVLLMVESFGLMLLTRDMSISKTHLAIVLLVGLIAALIQYGFVIGMLIGTIIYYLFENGLFNFGRKLIG